MSIEVLTTATEPMTEQMAELDAMRRMVEASRGTFSLSVAVCNSPALRDHLIGRLTEARPGIALVSISDNVTDPFEFVTSQLNTRQPDALFIVDLERIIPSDAKEQGSLRSLNASRELWERRFRCPVVLWLPEYAATLLSIQARDLWRYRSHRFQFVVESVGNTPVTSERFSDNGSLASNLSQDEKQFRIAELEQRLADAGASADPGLAEHRLRWLNELAFLHYSLGRLDEAEDHWSKLSDLAANSASQAHLANAYGNLGVLLQIRGNLDKAEAMHRKSLAINEKHGRLDGVAISYGNLGNVLKSRGDLDGAEAMQHNALATNEKLGRLGGMASNYGNLGNILNTRGDLDGAEAMYRKALAINEQLGHLEGLAGTYGNLGAVLSIRGDLVEAEAMVRTALAIDKKLGRLEAVARNYGNLGLILQSRGNLDGAEAMHRAALTIDEKLGRPEGLASAYSNLSSILHARGDLHGAREMLTKWRDLSVQLGKLT